MLFILLRRRILTCLTATDELASLSASTRFGLLKQNLRLADLIIKLFWFNIHSVEEQYRLFQGELDQQQWKVINVHNWLNYSCLLVTGICTGQYPLVWSLWAAWSCSLWRKHEEFSQADTLLPLSSDTWWLVNHCSSHNADDIQTREYSHCGPDSWEHQETIVDHVEKTSAEQNF